MITWPVIIHYYGNNELFCCASQSDWENDIELNIYDYKLEDRLIDSEGKIFSLLQRQGDLVTPLNTGQIISLEMMSDLVRLHASELGQCCVQKIFFNTVSQAINAVEFLSDE